MNLELNEQQIAQLNREIYHSPAKFSEKILGLPLHAGQLRWIENSTHRINILRPGNRYGKMQPNNEPILTSQGWVEMGSIKKGDRVFTQDGSLTQVIGVYPQGKLHTYKFIFDDNSSTTSGDEHLWLVKTRQARFKTLYYEKGKEYKNKRFGKWEVMTTKEIIDAWGMFPKPKNRVVIPMVKPIQFPKKALPLNPYLMGLLLGDGTFRHQIGFSTGDRELVLALGNNKRKSTYDYILYGLTDTIRRLGLFGLYSWDKHIPDIFLFNNIQNRIELLQGLLDTDGSVCGKASQVEFCSTSKKLAEQVVFLVQSLGGKAILSEKKTYFTYKGIKKSGRMAYRVGIRLSICPFKLERKRKKWHSKSYGNERYLTKVEDTGFQESTCIQVSHPSQLYVTKDCIVTHNTLVAAVKHIWHCMCKPCLEGKVKSNEEWLRVEYQTLNFGPTYELGRGALQLARDIVQGNILLPDGTTNKSLLKDWAITDDRADAQVLPYVEFKTGARLLGRSFSEMGVAFKMKALAYVSGDECGDINELWTFTNNTLLPRVVSLNGTIDLVGTPQPEGTDYMSMIEMAEEDMAKPDWKEHGLFYTQKGSMYENTFLPREAIAEIESIADPTMREQIIRGEYVEIGEKYFGFTRIQNCIDEKLKLEEQGLPGRKYITVADYAGGESAWADFTVIATIDYTEEPYRIVQFTRFKGGDVSIPMQYKLTEEITLKFGGKGKLLIDSSSLGGKNAMAFLGHLNPISCEYGSNRQGTMKAEMLATLKITLDGGNTERRRIREKNEQGDFIDLVKDWGLIRFPNIPVLINELQNYKLDDSKIRQDCVMVMAMGIHWIEMRRPKVIRKRAVDFDFLGF